MTTKILEFDDVSAGYNKGYVIHNLSFSLENNSVLALVGLNGSGKSTLLKLCTGVLKVSRGALLIRDRPVNNYTARERAQHVALVPQGFSFPTSLSVYDFVVMGRYPYLGPFRALSAVDRSIIKDALLRTGVFEFKDSPLSSLSGGERQRAAIAAALAQDAELLLLDEPATYLDPAARAATYRLVRELKKTAGRSVIFATHDLNDALAVADKVLALKEGRLKFLGDVSEFYNKDLLDAVYGDVFEIIRPAQSSAPVFTLKGL
ncbi:MAG: ABC transporter ATP-binding protein [Candidatus Dadabacteria bacterium]|nr:MAG: ABC transporter ATP-binding protein [Candidatus Dadabacteria bacterium]